MGLYNGYRNGTLDGLMGGLDSGSRHGLFSETKATREDKFAIAFIGDSNADGAAFGYTPCPPQTLYNYTTGGTVEIRGQSVANNSPASGSIAQPFAVAYKQATGRPTLLINASQGGSTFWSGTFSWHTTGTLYDAFKAKVAAGLAANDKRQLDAIVLNLGINDVRAGYSLANITTGVNSLFSRLATDFPGIPILVIQVGRTESAILSLALYQIRELLVDTVNSNADAHIVSCAAVLAFLNGYEADAIHYNPYGQSVIASNIVKWLLNPGYSKWGRSVICQLFDNPNPARKTKIDTFISSQVANGNYFKMDELNVLKTGHVNNVFLDWTMIGYGVQRTSTFVADDSIATDGISQRYDPAYVPNLQDKRATKTNVIAGAKVKTRTTTTGAYLFGVYNGVDSFLGIQQNTSPTVIKYVASDNTLSLGTDILFQAGNLYSVARTGTTKKLLKNKVTQASVVVSANTDFNGRPFALGALNSNGTLNTWIAASYEYFFVSQHDTFDLDSFYDEIETMLTGW